MLFCAHSHLLPQLPRQALSPPAFLEWMATCRTGSRIYGIAHLWPTNPGLEFPKESSRLPSRLLHWRAWLEWSLLHTAPSLRINDGLAGPASSSGRKDTNLPPFVRKSSEFGDLATERSFLEGLNGLRHRLRHPSSSKATIWKLLTLTFSTFFCASTLRPDQRLHAVVLTCTYILIRYHGCYYRNDSAEKTFEKNTFLVNFGHPDFPTFFESVLFRVMCSRCNPQTNVGKQLLRNFW